MIRSVGWGCRCAVLGYAGGVAIGVALDILFVPTAYGRNRFLVLAVPPPLFAVIGALVGLKIARVRSQQEEPEGEED